MKRFFMALTLVLMGISMARGSTIQYVLAELAPQEICGTEYDKIWELFHFNNNGFLYGQCKGGNGSDAAYRYFLRRGDTGEFLLQDERFDAIIGLDDKNVVTVVTGPYTTGTWHQWDADTGKVWRRDAHILPETENGIYIINRYGLSTSDELPSVWSKPFGLQEIPRPTDRECEPMVGSISEWNIIDVSEAYLASLKCYGGTSYAYDYIYDMISKELKPLCKSCTRGSKIRGVNSHGEAITDFHGARSLMDLRTLETIRGYGDCYPIVNSPNNNGDTLCDHNGPGYLPIAIARRDGTLDYLTMETPPDIETSFASFEHFNDKEQFILRLAPHNSEVPARYYLAEPVGILP